MAVVSKDLFYRPGINDMMENSLPYNARRSIGQEEEEHNFNGLLE